MYPKLFFTILFLLIRKLAVKYVPEKFKNHGKIVSTSEKMFTRKTRAKLTWRTPMQLPKYLPKKPMKNSYAPMHLLIHLQNYGELQRLLPKRLPEKLWKIPPHNLLLTHTTVSLFGELLLSPTPLHNLLSPSSISPASKENTYLSYNRL